AMMLQNKLAERTKLLSQLEQAKMQEQVSKSLNQMSELAAPGNTPSLEEVRDKIEKRYTTALGSAELASNSVQGRMMEVQASTTEMAGQSRLEQIRASMGGGSVAPQVTSGSSAKATPAANVEAEIAQRVAQEQKANGQTN
ncbi:MAG TPA: PspA/IM30 family protein, partial [Actinophytocola sp.]|nr:PspA/IM30 family protein [Actinophytocola sp.]